MNWTCSIRVCVQCIVCIASSMSRSVLVQCSSVRRRMQQTHNKLYKLTHIQQIEIRNSKCWSWYSIINKITLWSRNAFRLVAFFNFPEIDIELVKWVWNIFFFCVNFCFVFIFMFCLFLFLTVRYSMERQQQRQQNS